MTGAENFVHVAANMYVTLTPLIPGKADSMMEDFFDLKTKETLIDGKGFDPNNNMNTATDYGKHVFAQKVVAADAKSIDFSGFNGILSNVSSIVAAHVKP